MNKLLLSRECIEVQCSASDTETQCTLSNFYPVHKNRKLTEFRLPSRMVPELLLSLRGLDASNIYTAPRRIQEYFFTEISARQHVEDLLLNGPTEDCRVNQHLTLMPHQQLAREIAKYRDRFGFFYDTRTGKTPLSLSIIYDDIKANPAHKRLIVCPLILIENAWLEDAVKFFPEIGVVNCHATTQTARLKKLQKQASIYITNTESFSKYQEYFEDMNFAGCFVDESSSMKSASSKQSKSLVDFAQKVKRFYLLSGTPAPNGEWEYFMQLRAIDYYCMPQSYAQFKERYFINTSFNPQYEKLALRPDHKEELYAILRKYTLYVDKEDVLTTPGRTFHEYEFELPSELKKHYNKLKNEMYIELGDSLQITAPSAAAKLNKLNQVTSGFIIDTQAIKENKFYGDDKQEWYMLDSYRFDVLLNLLIEQGIEQVLIWANYRREFEILKELLGESCRCVFGGTSIQDKNEAIKAFKAGEIQYLIANPASADKGLTLTNCHICVYFSLNYSYELFKQSMERIYGSITSQPKHCHYYVFIAKGTVDRVIYSDVLKGKGDASGAVLAHLKAGDI